MHGLNMSWTKKIRSFLPVIGIVFLLVILFSIDREKIWSILSKADPLWLAAALAVNAAAIVIKGFKWKTFFFEKKSKVSTLDCISGFLKGFFLSVITPGRVGDFARALFVKEKTGFPFAMASVILDRITDIALLLALSLVSLASFFYLTGKWIISPFLVLALLLAMLIGLFYVLRQSKKGFFRSIFFSLAPERHRERIQNAYNEILSELQKTTRQPGLLLPGLLLGIAAWVLSAIIGFWIALSIGINLPFYFFGITVLLLALLEIIPITFAGLGTREAGAIFLFSTVGVSAETAVAYSLLFFFIAYIPTSVVGGILFIQKPVAV